MPQTPTPRQREALLWMAHGCTVDETAHQMGITRATAKNTLYEAYLRIGANGLIDAFLILGWLRPPEITR
jgi:DNA-binding CsgD family transcriptional regulator